MIERKYKLKRTKVVATIGPSCMSKKTIRKMILAGMNICRLNFSHCKHKDAEEIIAIISELNEELNVNVGLLGDLQGPKLRIGPVDNNNYLTKNNEIIIQEGFGASNNKNIFIPHPNIVGDLKVGEKILLDDGKIILKIVRIIDVGVVCVIIQGGELNANKGFNLPNSILSIPTMTNKDQSDLLFCIKRLWGA